MKLAEIMTKPGAFLFAEHHRASGLPRKYKAIFAAAQEAGVKDCAIETPPEFDEDITETILIYREIKTKFGVHHLLDLLNDEKKEEDAYHAMTLLGAIYDIDVHAVDVGLRQELDIDLFRCATEMWTKFAKPHGIRPADYFSGLSADELKPLQEMAGFAIAGMEVFTRVNNILKSGGIQPYLDRRVTEGDALIAEKIRLHISDRPFFGIFGSAHLGSTGLSGSLADCLRKDRNVTVVDMTSNSVHSEAFTPDFVMDSHGDVTPARSTRPMQPSIVRLMVGFAHRVMKKLG